VLAIYANGRDPFAEYFRVSPAFALNGNAGAVKSFKIGIPINFYDSNLEFPNAGCPSAMQLNRDGVEVNLETDGAHCMTVGDGVLPLAGGNAQVVVSAVKLYATTSKVPRRLLRADPVHADAASHAATGHRKGPFWERFLAMEVDPLTYEAQVSSITIEIDQVTPRNAAPTELPRSLARRRSKTGSCRSIS
jgi:hypothetical protein